jgi:hypothetical protein
VEALVATEKRYVARGLADEKAHVIAGAAPGGGIVGFFLRFVVNDGDWEDR